MDLGSATLYNGLVEARWLDADGVEQKKRGRPWELAAIIKYAGVHHDVVLLFDVDDDGEPDRLCFACWRPANQSTVRIRERLHAHVDQLRRVATSCAVVFALLVVFGCRGPIGPQGDVGQQGDKGQQGPPGRDAGNILRVSGRLNTEGYAVVVICEDADEAWPEEMPLVNVWLRKTSSDTYCQISKYVGSVVTIARAPGYQQLRELGIVFGVEGLAGWQYLAVIVFYENTQIVLSGLRFPVVGPPVRDIWRRPLINDRPGRAERARYTVKTVGQLFFVRRDLSGSRSRSTSLSIEVAKAHGIDVLFLVERERKTQAAQRIV